MSTTVHITDQGNQTIYGVKTFDVFPIVSGNKLITGVNLSSYLTSSTASSTYSTITNLASTGSTLTNNIVSLSGLFTGFTGNLDTTFASDVQLANTGSTLVTSINSLSGLFTGFTGALDATFASDIQLASTGSTLQTNINNLSNTYATITNLASTGSTLVTNLASTGSTLDVKINNLSGVSVLTFGNQTISGVKTFATGVNISGHVGIGINSNNFNLYVRKSPAGVSVNPDSNSIAVFEGSGSSHITVLGSTSASAGVVLGSPADTFGSYLSWNHDNNALKLSTAKPSGFIQLLTNDEVEALRITSGANVGIGTTSPSEKLQVVGNILANNLVYNTGNQNVSGIKSFYSRPTVNGTGVLLSGEAASLPTTIVYTTGNQTITGIKTFKDTILVDQSSVILSGAALTLVTKIITGSTVTVTQGDYAVTQVVDYIEGDVAITRGVNGGPYNPNEQGSWDGIGPTYTTWNTEGWNDLSNIQSRTYVASMQGAMGENFNNITNYDFVMRDTQNNRYYKLKFNNWQVGAGNEGGYKGFSYTRTLLEPISPQINGLNVGGNLNLSNRLFINGTGVLLSGEAGQVSNTVVQTSGAQTISGIKTFNATTIFNSGTTFNSAATFNNNITVAQTGIFSSMDVYVDEMNISGLNLVLTSGTGIFNNDIDLKNSRVLNASNLAYLTGLASTGSTLNNSIISLSGLFTGYTGSLDTLYATDTQLFNTGSTLVNSINSFSGLFTGYTGSLDATFASDTQLANTGSTLNTRINNLSGYINSTSSNIVFTTGNQTISGTKTFIQDATFGDTGQGDFLVISGNNFTVYGSGNFTSGLFVNGNTVLTGSSTLYATSANLASTGSTLTNSINSLSGTLTSNYATITNLISTGNTLQNSINSLSGSSVLLYGDQSIDGVKSFRDNVYINNLFVTGTETIVNTPQINIASNYLLLNLTGGAVDGGIFFVTGVGLTGVNDAGPIIGFDHVNRFKFGVSTRSSDLSTLPDVASVQQIEAYSGVADNKFSTITNLASTGSTLDTKINNLSGYINSSSSDIVYTTGDQSIAGIKTFSSNALFEKDVNVTQNLRVSGNSFFTGNLSVTGNLNVGGNINNPNLVLTKGNQTISGTKTFDVAPIFNGNPLITVADLSSYAPSSEVVYTTGVQSIAGIKTFSSNSFFTNDVNVTQNLRVSGNSFFTGNLSVTDNLTVGGDINNQNLVFTKGKQTISGDKTFVDKININAYTGNGYDITNNEFALNIGGNLNDNAGILVDAYGINPPQILMRRARGTPTGLSGVLKDDVLFNLQARGYVSGLNDYSTNSRAAIRLIAAEDWVGTAGYTGQGTNILFRTTNIGTGAAIDKVIIGTSGINLLNGNIYISGNPVSTGVDLTPYALSNAVVYTTGNQTVSGIKNFQSAPLVSGKEVYYQKNIVYFTGNSFTPDYISGRNFVYQLTGFATVYNNLNNPINMPEGEAVLVKVVQSNFGNNYMIFGSDYRFPASASPTLTQPSGRVDIFNILKLDNKFYTTYVKDFAN